LKEDMEL